MDLDPETGDVVVLAVILIQAAMITKSQSQKFNVSSLSSKQYQAGSKTRSSIFLLLSILIKKEEEDDNCSLASNIIDSFFKNIFIDIIFIG